MPKSLDGGGAIRKPLGEQLVGAVKSGGRDIIRSVAREVLQTGIQGAVRAFTT